MDVVYGREEDRAGPILQLFLSYYFILTEGTDVTASSEGTTLDSAVAGGVAAAPPPTQRSDPADGELPHDLVLAMRGLYRQAGVATTRAPEREQESGEYGACRLHLEGRVVVFRVARTTPTKTGQFVTLWKRPAPGDSIAPLDSGDGIDLVIVSVADATRRGQFVFDQQALLRHGVMSRDGQGGKRAIRVYPPWSTPVAKDAIKTQQWQLRHFVALAPADADAAVRLRQLLGA